MNHDSPEHHIRQRILASDYIVVKIGSSAIADVDCGLNKERMRALARAIESRIQQGTHVVMVSSGAIAAGMPILGLTSRPKDLATKQAAASVGQMALTQAWSDAFSEYGRIVGQILLTSSDFAHRTHHNNAARTFNRLRALGAIPIVNENDTLATEEIRFGDNDRLAALLTHLISAQALYLFSDIDALYTSDPRKGDAQALSFIDYPRLISGINAGKGGNLGTGGMASKLDAALLAADTGVPVLLTSATLAQQALTGQCVGTVFAPATKRLSAKKFWLHSVAEIAGSIAIDAGAVQAITHYRKSLLLNGVQQVEGDFPAGAIINIVNDHGDVIARGKTTYPSDYIRQYHLDSAQSEKKESLKPVVHADDLAIVTINTQIDTA